MPHAAIALGGNVGPVADNFQRAATKLSQRRVVVEQSSALYETQGVGSEGGMYLNAALLVTTEQSAAQLFKALYQIEEELGRARDVQWGPRPIDLDLIWYDDLVCETSELTLPHPACWYRRFVLDPLADLCPDWVHPFKNASISALLDRMRLRPLRIGIAGGTESDRARLVRSAEGASREVALVAVDSPTSALVNNLAIVAWIGTPDGLTPEMAERRERVARPQSESDDPLFFRWPPTSRLDVSLDAQTGDDWLHWLIQSAAAEPKRLLTTAALSPVMDEREPRS